MSIKIEITGSGIYGAEGKEIAIGETFTVKEEPKGWAGRYRVVSDTDGKVAVTNPKGKAKPAKVDDKPAFTTEEREGAFVILNADGEVQGAPLTADDAKVFSELPADQQAEFVAGHIEA